MVQGNNCLTGSLVLANCEIEEAVMKIAKPLTSSRLVVKTMLTNLNVVLAVQKNVLCFQVMMKQWWSHVMEKVNAQSDFIQNAQPERPGHHWIHDFLRERKKEQSIKMT